MVFTTSSWADWLKPFWERQVKPLVKVNSKILEIGSFEGNSTIWWIEHLNPYQIDCIDTFGGSEEHTEDNVKNLLKNFNENTKIYQESGVLHVNIGRSHDIMPKLQPNSYDFIYIDGSHVGKDVMYDAILANLLLKSGGYLLFDDYAWRENKIPGDYKDCVMNPKYAIDSFRLLYKDVYDDIALVGGYQMLLRKK